MRLLRWQHILTLAVVLLCTGRAAAHKVGADCKVNGGHVELEAYFDDDTPASAARVRIEDAGQQLIAEGLTDADGRWSFDQPPDGTYRIVVDAGAGHRTELKLTLPIAPVPSAAASASASAASGGRNRAAFTAYPWLQLGLGVAILGAVAAAFWIAARQRKR